MKYAVITACAAEYTVAFMCRVLGVAPSGCYEWRADDGADERGMSRLDAVGLGEPLRVSACTP